MGLTSDHTKEAQTTVLNAVRDGVLTNDELVEFVKELLSTESVHSIEYGLGKMGLDLADLDHRVLEQQFEDCTWYEHKDLMNKGVV